jgi:hypothetical protein
MKSPIRHDFIASCVHNEVSNFIWQVEKKIKICNIVKMSEKDLDRKYCTKHGQHLKLPRKELISMKLTTFIKEFSTKKQLPPICLQWKDSISEGLKSRLSKTEVRLIHPEDRNNSNLDDVSRILHPSK